MTVIAESEKLKAKNCKPLPPPAVEGIDFANPDLVIVVLAKHGVKLNGVVADCIEERNARDNYIKVLKERLE